MSFFVKEPYVIFGLANLISFSDQRTLIHFRSRRPYFVFELTTSGPHYFFGLVQTKFQIRINELFFMFGLANPSSRTNQANGSLFKFGPLRYRKRYFIFELSDQKTFALTSCYHCGFNSIQNSYVLHDIMQTSQALVSTPSTMSYRY